MSKMRMPEMSVVRFNESDVIVASDSLRIVNLQKGDGAHNGSMTYRNVEYNYDNYSTLSSLLPSDNIYSATDGVTYTVRNLFETDSDESTQYNIGTPDGTYYFDSIAGYWKQ